LQIQVLRFWESMAAVTGFAGSTLQAAVVHPAAQAALLSFDKTVEHYTVQQYHA